MRPSATSRPRNIAFIVPPADYESGGIPTPISQTEVGSYYLTPIANYIENQGLTNQINYIGTIGEATCYATLPMSGSQTRTRTRIRSITPWVC